MGNVDRGRTVLAATIWCRLSRLGDQARIVVAHRASAAIRLPPTGVQYFAVRFAAVPRCASPHSLWSGSIPGKRSRQLAAVGFCMLAGCIVVDHFWDNRINVNWEEAYESDCMDKIRTTGCSSAQRGRKTYSQGQ